MRSSTEGPGRRRILAIDPGNPDLGAAIFGEGRLIQSAWVRCARPQDGTCPACILRKPCRHGIEPALVTRLCDELEQQLGLSKLGPGDPAMPEVLVCELPLYFSAELGGGGPIGKLLTVVGALCDRAAAWGASAYLYRPSEWKGTAAKATHQALALCSFSEDELALIPRVGRGNKWKYNSDAVDAALLGAWWLERARARTPARGGDWAELQRRVQT